MKPETRLQRHAQLWKSGTVSARRVAIAGLIFAVLILLRVVEPYHQVEREGQQAKAKLEAEAVMLLKQQEQLAIIERTLQEIEDELGQQPWNVEMDKLIKYFKDLRTSGSEDLPVPQDMANQTIGNIVEMVESRVIKKLRAVMAAPETSERLADYPDRIQDALNNWKNDNYDNTQWYFTPGSKIETINGMGAVLSVLKNEALAAVNESKLSIPGKKADIERRKAEIPKEIEKATESIKAELDKILPSWAQNSVGVKSMIVFYPWILVAFAAYLTGIALIAARHFHGMADEEQWTAVERSDPLLSSPWTLTWRGVTGTTVTLVNYFAVILVLGFCIGRAVKPPSSEGDAAVTGSSDGTAVADSSHALADAMSVVLPLELAYGLLLATLAVVVATPLWRRTQKTSSSQSASGS
jgi:hypothetical protein